MIKNLPANAGDTRDMGWIPGSGSSPREKENGNPLQYSGLEIFKDRRAWTEESMGSQRAAHD